MKAAPYRSSGLGHQIVALKLASVTIGSYLNWMKVYTKLFCTMNKTDEIKILTFAFNSFILLYTYLNSCSKLTTSLVNVFLKLKNVMILQIHCYFCWKNVRIFCSAKDSYIFPTKNNSVFDNLVGIYLTSWRLNDVVRLTILWTAGPRISHIHIG